MSAFIIFQSNITDMEKFQKYAKSVPATLEPYNGDVLIKGTSDTIFRGGNQFANVGILRFPDIRHANDWYESAAYQALIPDRDKAADMNVVSYEAP